MQDALSPGSSLTTRYQIQRTLGRTAGGFLYQALDRQQAVWIMELYPAGSRRAGPLVILAPDVATLRTQWRARLSAWRQLQHPSAVPVLDLLDLFGTTYAVLPPQAGVTLAERLTRQEPLSTGAARALAVTAADVLAQLHRADQPDGAFGPDRLRLVGDRILVEPGWAVPCHEAFTAPEVALVQQPPTTVSDVYALAATTLAAVLGRTPPTAAQRSKGASLPASTPSALDRALRAGLALSPGDRPSTAHAFRQCLDTPTPATAEGPVRRVQAHASWVTHLVFLDGTLVSAGADGLIRSFHHDLRVHSSWACDAGRLTGLTVQAGRVVASDASGRLLVWHDGAPSSARSTQGITHLAALADGTQLITINADNSLSLWSVQGPRQLHSTPPQPAWLRAISVPQDRPVVLIGAADGHVQQLNLHTALPDWTWQSSHAGPVSALSSWHTLTAVGQGAQVSLLRNGQQERVWSCPEEVTAVAFAPAQHRVLATGRQGGLFACPFAPGADVRQLYSADSPLCCLAVQDTTVAFGSQGGALFVADSSGWT